MQPISNQNIGATMNKDDIVRDAILQAAERVFQKWGMNKTTMEDIASEAGKGKSTLYYYYESKEEIFDAVIKIEFEKILALARESTIEVASAREKLKRYIITSIIEIKNKINVYTIVRIEIKRNQNFLEKMRKLFELKEESFVREILKLGLEKKEFSFIDRNELNTAAKTIIGVIHALELYLLLENDDTKQIDMAAKMISEGV
jgi:AcrR family transcriptional regulator